MFQATEKQWITLQQKAGNSRAWTPAIQLESPKLQVLTALHREDLQEIEDVSIPLFQPAACHSKMRGEC